MRHFKEELQYKCHTQRGKGESDFYKSTFEIFLIKTNLHIE